MADQLDVVVAAVAAIPPTLAAGSALFVSLRNHKQLKGNGRGTHTQMLEKLDDKVDDLGTAMSDHMKEDRRMFDQAFRSMDLFTEELKSIARTSTRNGMRD